MPRNKGGEKWGSVSNREESWDIKRDSKKLYDIWLLNIPLVFLITYN